MHDKSQNREHRRNDDAAVVQGQEQKQQRTYGDVGDSEADEPGRMTAL
jgi:hypothetical protein